MNIDKSFIKLYLNDFVKAKSGANPNVATLLYDGFIVQLPNETFVQETNSDVDISFAGAIQVDLINSCGVVVKNIDNNFAYTSFINSQGIEQIRFEFGLINENFYTKPLYLKITDLINGNIYYSNSFIVTDYYSKNTTRFDYFNNGDVVKKSIRLNNCYYHTPQNKLELKSYTTTQGFQTSYQNTPTYLQKYLIDQLDFLVNDSVTDMLCSEIVYVNNVRSNVSEYKSDERKGNTNFLSAEFLVNPLNQLKNWNLQIMQNFNLVTFTPSGVYTAQVPVYPNRTFNNKFSLKFGSNPSITNKQFNNKFNNKFG
ncbi:hypothetical protein UFOVP584_8 [uncultured Caudovirales phage]|uniref:Uncharacterized protein n=1 Tax=uncultured Caudovirales phage TaxID=2100421 RepID=A0A6J5MY13_9CAUD|nr:hypothetical protein UFOVP304_43 [uncultured Caudovirales phage]CAB4151262.1 hypothetical protein UFOVP584_8 [uncultured Caudovirales phage]